jgi:hypothetical protein
MLERFAPARYWRRQVDPAAPTGQFDAVNVT